MLQEGQGGSSRLGSATPSGIDHGKITVKNETNSAPDTSTNNNDIGDIQMDDDDDMLGEIEGMDTMA